jgi:hypothetical protein
VRIDSSPFGGSVNIESGSGTATDSVGVRIATALGVLSSAGSGSLVFSTGATESRTQVEQIERCVEQYQRRGAAAGDVYEVAELRLGVVANRAEDCDDGPRPTEVKQIPFKQIRLSLWVRNRVWLVSLHTCSSSHRIPFLCRGKSDRICRAPWYKPRAHQFRP